MRAVGRFESNLLRILHSLLGRAPIERALPLLVDRRDPPACLGRDAVELVQDALARGCAWQLARRGGWRAERHLRGDRVASGRLWERTPPEALGLSFSRHTLAFLIWLTAEHPGDPARPWDAPEAELSVGDRLLLFFAFEALRAIGMADDLRAWPPFARHGLCRIAYPEAFDAGRTSDPIDLSTWVEGPGACILEALQPALAARWVAVERGKAEIADADLMRRLGRSQEAALDALIPALDRAGRRDLGRFLLEAASTLLRDAPGPGAWVGSLHLEGLRLADRANIYRAASAFLRSLDRLQGWERDARSVGYFDEGYAAAQLWKADWEASEGEALCDRARSIVRALDPLGP